VTILGNPGGSPAADSEEHAVEHHLSTVGRLAALTADALEDVASAARTGDVTGAKQVLRGSRRRRVARAEAEHAVRRMRTLQPPRPGAIRRTACELQLITELGRIGDLVDAFARLLAADRTPRPVLDALAHDLETMGGAGGRRLRQLANLAGPAMDGSYLRTGVTLRESLDRLASPSCAVGSPVGAGTQLATACSCLIRAVLSASSFAARVA
jgi:hypothetical protein